MTAPEIEISAVPTGGAIALTISGAVSGASTLERAASGVAGASGYSTIYTAPTSLAYYLDPGDKLPAPLDAALVYKYRYTDLSGVTETAYVSPATTVQVIPDSTTYTLVRLIQGGLNSLILPPNMPKILVTQAMPLGGFPTMPFLVVNQDLIQMNEIPIGQSVTPISQATGQQILTQFATRTYRVSVLCANAEQLDFYRDATIGIFEALYQSVLQPLGLDVMHRWQSTSGQVANDRMGKMPGFYFAEIMLDFKGTLNTVINPALGLVEEIQVTASLGDGGTVQLVVNAPPE